MISKSEISYNQAEKKGGAPSENVDLNQTSLVEDFEKESQINLDPERLTYICDYCGKVNHIDEPRCLRCGKRRPRSEFVKAMTAVRESKIAKQEYEAQKAAKELERQQAEKYLEQRSAQMFADKEAAQKLELARIMEEKLADEKMKMAAREEARIEQERDHAKKMAAREAVLQIIAAEKYADEIVAHTKKDATLALKEQEAEYKKKIAEEREKAINIAAEKLVAERAGIERYAAEQISKIKDSSERMAKERILAERDQSEKMAARRAVLQIIAAEKAAEEELRINKEALSRAALRRIEEERELAQKESNARFLAERQGIERAAEERIRAEREAVKRLLEEKKAWEMSQTAVTPPPDLAQNKQIIQPFVVVPYVNSQQPLLQYRPNQVYRFVPNTYTEQLEAKERAERDLRVMQEGPQPTDQEIKELLAKKQREKELVEQELNQLKKADMHTEDYQKTDKKGKLRVRLVALFSALFALGFGAVLWFLPLLSNNVYSDPNGNLNIFTGFLVLLQDGINGIVGTELALLEANSFVEFITSLDFLGGIVLPFGLFVAVITYAVILIRSIVRIITGRARTKGLFLSIFGFVFIQIIVAGIFLLTNTMELEFINNIEISVYILEGLGLLTLIMAIINKINCRKRI
ncbi:MAG: hypothetical protein QM214_03590 [Bacillota bacterium]|nr:hypothetical protein [Bacillota bacterium]HHU43832.1 hypothetical protein [Clostridiales bacterium]